MPTPVRIRLRSDRLCEMLSFLSRIHEKKEQYLLAEASSSSSAANTRAKVRGLHSKSRDFRTRNEPLHHMCPTVVSLSSGQCQVDHAERCNRSEQHQAWDVSLSPAGLTGRIPCAQATAHQACEANRKTHELKPVESGRRRSFAALHLPPGTGLATHRRIATPLLCASVSLLRSGPSSPTSRTPERPLRRCVTLSGMLRPDAGKLHRELPAGSWSRESICSAACVDWRRPGHRKNERNRPDLFVQRPAAGCRSTTAKDEDWGSAGDGGRLEVARRVACHCFSVYPRCRENAEHRMMPPQRKVSFDF